MNAATLMRALWFAGGLAILLGWGRDTILGWQPRPRELPRADNRTGQPWVTGDFQRDERVAPGPLPGHIQHASSFVSGDAFTGRSESAWFRTSRRTIHVGVAGYPNKTGCALWAEFRDPAGRIARIDCRLPDPREVWSRWEIRRPAGFTEVRIIGEDRSSAYAGWLAFSHPFRAWPPELEAVYSLVQVATTLALALVLGWGPGLLWCPAGATSTTRAVWFLGAGPAALVLAGIGVWLTSGIMSPQVTGTAFGIVLWLVVGRGARRRKFRLEADPFLMRAIAVAALVVAAVAARAACSAGPAGELFRGTISRNFQLSDRIDSRFSFYAVQAAAHHWGPASPTTEKFYYPWTFFSRGPLAGLAAIPVVMATAGRPPAGHAEQTWEPFDRTGFAAYRITMYALAAGVLVAFHLLLAPLVGGRWALLGCGLVALAPFGLHEVLFTWPKWAATAWLATAFAFVISRRPVAGGLCLGVGFLYHPLVLLWSPCLALWWAGSSGRNIGAAAGGVARLGLAAAALVLPWMALGKMMPHLPDTPFAGQGGFLRYWILADSHFATWETWLRTRWMNFANTFVPLHLFADAESFRHFRFSSAYETSGPAEKTLFLGWNSLPFALGLGLWVASAVAATRLVRRHFAAAAVLLLAPAGLLVAYWGGDPLGLMRECGHPLFLSVIGATVWIAARETSRLGALLAHPATPWLQLPETLALLWFATWANPAPHARMHHGLDAVALGLHVVCLAGAAAVLARARRDRPDTVSR